MKAACEEVSLEVYLVNGKSVTLDGLSTDQTDEVLEALSEKIDIQRDLTYYFGLVVVEVCATWAAVLHAFGRATEFWDSGCIFGLPSVLLHTCASLCVCFFCKHAPAVLPLVVVVVVGSCGRERHGHCSHCPAL